MDRLLSLRNSEANLSCNTSQSSELGYETARDDSFCSVYYSMNEDDTVTSIDDDDLSGQLVVPSTSATSSHVNDNISSFVGTGRSATEPIQSSENWDPILSANSNVAITQIVSVAENSNLPSESTISSTTTKYSSFVETRRSAVPIESSEYSDRASDNTNSNVAITETVSVAENYNLPSTNTMITNRDNLDHMISTQNSLQPFGLSIIPNLPPIPEVSTSMSNGISNYNRSSTVQVPTQTRATRSTIVRFQSADLPRRQTVISRRTLRDTRNEGMPSNRPVVTAGPSNLGRKSVVSTNHVCDICKMVFPLRSTLIVHKSSHNTKCKYCDKSFKKSIALSNHLKENCEKIPAAARRKILANEYKEKMMTM